MNIFGASFDYQKRLEKIRKHMDEWQIDAFLVLSWVNQYYVAGVYQHLPWYPVEANEQTENPLIIFRDRSKEPVFLITYLTSNQLKEQTWIKDIRVVDKEPYGKLDGLEYAAKALQEQGVADGVIGIEESVCVLSTFTKLQKVLPRAKFKHADEVFQSARIVKEPEEIALIKESVLIAEAGLLAGMAAAKVGVTEIEVQRAAEIEMKRLGAIREVETMCQSGRRTANHRCFGANWKKIEENDLFTIDIGCVYKGYGSDITRTWVVGKPTPEQNKIVSDLVNAHEKVLQFIKPGVTIKEAHAVWRNEIKGESYSFDRAVMPSKGIGLPSITIHGIGLGPMHDPPHVPDRDTRLETGMTIAVAGGTRFEDFTIRFEDNVVVVPGGIELINKRIPWKL